MNRVEAARLLNVTEATLVRWVRQGLLRAGDQQGRYFERSELERWARERGLPLGPPVESRHPSGDLLVGAVERGAVTPHAEVATASEAIELAVSALDGLSSATRRRLLEEVLERERMASTGLGQGFALPHPRKPPGKLIPEPVVSVVFPKVPLDWASLDDEPVHTVLLLLSPSTPVHLEILSRVAQGLRSPELPKLLREQPSQAELVAGMLSLQEEDG
jgi:PTS system nitrogen regulatory IIA component